MGVVQARAEIERVIRLQGRLVPDVLVHGEPERNDMVQYFAEHLDGFAVTRYGWVQSGHCRWARYAQSLTDRPVKGMLTGPVTIVAWSYVRDDLPLPDMVRQVADAIHAEVRDLEAAGIGVIQVDEPALRELLPLWLAAQDEYWTGPVRSFREYGGGHREQVVDRGGRVGGWVGEGPLVEAPVE